MKLKFGSFCSSCEMLFQCGTIARLLHSYPAHTWGQHTYLNSSHVDQHSKAGEVSTGALHHRFIANCEDILSGHVHNRPATTANTETEQNTVTESNTLQSNTVKHIAIEN